jgi:hypothetical protein
MNYYKIYQKIAIVTAILFLYSCATERPKINYEKTFVSSDSTYKYEVNHSYKNDTLEFKGFEIKQFNITFKEEDITFSQELILPKTSNVDFEKPIIILPGFQGSRANYLSFISYLQNNNRPIIIFNYRGVDKNKDLDIGTFETDKKDFVNLLDVYRSYTGLEKFSPSVFASSYGALLLMDSQKESRTTLESICLESMPINIREDLDRMPFGKYIEQKKQFQIPDSAKVLEKFKKLIMESRNILMVYGLADEYISNQEIDNLKSKVTDRKLDFLLVPKANHDIRIGFPLNQKEFDELNKKIAAFITE